MRMKKALVATLTAAMVFSLTACGSSGESAGGSSSGSKDASSSSSKSDDLISIGFAQVGHESDWRTASTESITFGLSAINIPLSGFALFKSCPSDNLAYISSSFASKSFISIMFILFPHFRTTC